MFVLGGTFHALGEPETEVVHNPDGDRDPHTLASNAEDECESVLLLRRTLVVRGLAIDALIYPLVLLTPDSGLLW